MHAVMHALFRVSAGDMALLFVGAFLGFLAGRASK